MIPDVILIDDDLIVRETWALLCREQGVQIVTVATLGELVARNLAGSEGVPVFVDHDLGGGVRGADVAAKLRERGYQRLYLATGYERRDLPPDVVAKFDGVVGKDPPAWLWRKA